MGIITIRDDEFRAILTAFPEDAGIYKGRREYTLRWADAGGGRRYRLAILRQLEQGNGEAQDAARDLFEDFNPALLLVVGIAGGLPSDDFSLGDVVLATRVNDYSVESRKEGEEPTYSLSGGPVAKDIAAGVANLAGREAELGDWTRDLPAHPAVSWTREGQLYGPPEWMREVAEKLEARFGDESTRMRPPHFVSGTIASSDRLVKDPKLLFPWIQTARHLLAVEMESGGVYRAARERCPMLAIRGISDIVGLKRSNDWTKYACATAAAFARAYLRTQPVTPQTSSSAPCSAPPGASSEGTRKFKNAPEPPTDNLYANLVPLRQFPDTIYVTPTTCHTYRQAWAVLREGTTERSPSAWVLQGKNLYSFVNPSSSRLSLITDTTAVESHASSDWAASANPDQRRLFSHLLNGALRDDLDAIGIWFFSKDGMFAFTGKLEDEPRTVEFMNVHQRSTMTVVSHYEAKLKDDTVVPFLRHNAFRGRFRFYDTVWYLEVTPTYRFTEGGKQKYRFHEHQLKGIKKLEKNRSVLSQLLLWCAVLRGEAARTDDDRPPTLTFTDPPTFRLEGGTTQDEWILLEDDGDQSQANTDEGSE